MGDCELPTDLEAAKTCARSLVTEKPIPQSFFALLDALDEVQDTMTCSKVNFRKRFLFILALLHNRNYKSVPTISSMRRVLTYHQT